MNRIWTVRNGWVSEGALVYKIDATTALAVGETGPNRRKGYAVLAEVTEMQSGPRYCQEALGVVTTATLRDYNLDPEEVVIVFETTPGLKGRAWQSTDPDGQQAIGDELIIARGRVALGDTGRRAQGEQLIIRARPGMTFFEHRSGHLNGEPAVHVTMVTSSGVEAMPLSRWQQSQRKGAIQ